MDNVQLWDCLILACNALEAVAKHDGSQWRYTKDGDVVGHQASPQEMAQVALKAIKELSHAKYLTA